MDRGSANRGRDTPDYFLFLIAFNLKKEHQTVVGIPVVDSAPCEGPPVRSAAQGGAGVAELVDARDSKSRGAWLCKGSTPFSGTKEGYARTSSGVNRRGC